MAEALTPLVSQVCRMAEAARCNQPSDRELLRRFAAERDRANYPFLLRQDGVTFRVDKGVSGLGDTPIPTQPQYRVLPNIPHTQTVVLRPLTADEARHGVLTGR